MINDASISFIHPMTPFAETGPSRRAESFSVAWIASRNGMRQEIHVRPSQQVILILLVSRAHFVPYLIFSFFSCFFLLSSLSLSLFRYFRATRT